MSNDALRAALAELVALVRGECPSLLDEDSGGSARLSMAIDAALAQPEPEPVAIGHDSRILHELAGAASLCWEPKPTGVFNTEKAIGVVEAALKELRESAAPPSAQRVPLTDERVIAEFEHMQSDGNAPMCFDLTDFRHGVSFAERAHGITAPKEQK